MTALFSRGIDATMNLRTPSARYADLFGARVADLHEYHLPGRVRFTWNARGALFQLLRELPHRDRTTVLVPAFHCMALIQPIVAAGFEIACYRIRPDFTVDLGDLAAQMGSHVAAVLVIHYFGFPADLDEIVPLAQHQGALVIEDCSHSFLTRDLHMPLGRRGHYAIYSYYKCVPSVVGGALVANGNAPLPAVPARCAPWPARLTILRRWIKQADERNPMRAMQLTQRALSALTRLVFVGYERRKGLAPGFLDEPYLFHPALASSSLPHWVPRIIEGADWNAIVRARRRHYTALCSLLHDTSVIHRPIPTLPEGVVPYMFPVMFRNRIHHEAALRAAGIPFLRFGETLHGALNAASQGARADAEALSRSLLLLPVHQDLDHHDVERLAARLVDYAARHG